MISRAMQRTFAQPTCRCCGHYRPRPPTTVSTTTESPPAIGHSELRNRCLRLNRVPPATLRRSCRRPAQARSRIETRRASSPLSKHSINAPGSRGGRGNAGPRAEVRGPLSFSVAALPTSLRFLSPHHALRENSGHPISRASPRRFLSHSGGGARPSNGRRRPRGDFCGK